MSRQPSSPRRDAKLAVRLLRRSDILIDRGKFSNALDICQQALEADPGSAEIYRRVGALAVLLKRPQTAVDAFEIALKLDPTDSVALCNMGAALRDLGRTDEARLRLETSVRANPGHPSGWFNLGMVYADLARWSDAALCYRRALQGCASTRESGCWVVGVAVGTRAWRRSGCDRAAITRMGARFPGTAYLLIRSAADDGRPGRRLLGI